MPSRFRGTTPYCTIFTDPKYYERESTNMKFSYYPGCTLKTKGKDLDRYGRLAAEALGFELSELADWQCCGAVYPMAKDEIATKLSAVRALVSARDEGQELVTLCSACHNVIKQVNHDMATDADIALRVNNYLGLEMPYHGETKKSIMIVPQFVQFC